MAQFEHVCKDILCGYSTFNSYGHSPKLCPKCGQELVHVADESEYAEYEQEYGED